MRSQNVTTRQKGTIKAYNYPHINAENIWKTDTRLTAWSQARTYSAAKNVKNNMLIICSTAMTR